jgi:hypothetical protein
MQIICIFLGQILIISDMYNKDVRFIIRRKNLWFKKHFTHPIQEFLGI